MEFPFLFLFTTTKKNNLTLKANTSIYLVLMFLYQQL